MPNSIIAKKIFGGALIAFALKFSGALLSYVMFVVLARAMSFSEFGIFSFVFSIALFLGSLTLAGQQQFILRTLPNFDVDDRQSLSPVRFSIFRMCWVFLSISVTLAFINAAFPQYLGVGIFPVMLLTASLALSDFLSSILRVSGNLILALSPKDIVWRLLIILYCYCVITKMLPGPSAELIIGLSGASLLVLVLLQSWFCRELSLRDIIASMLRSNTPEWTRMSNFFWVTSTLSFVAPALSVVFIGLIIDREASGPFFAALKTAQVMTLVLLAANIVASPLLSKLMSAGDMEASQEVCRLTSVLAGGSSAVGFIVLLVWGVEILAFFGEGFSTAYVPLLILAAGFVINGLNGSSGALLAMSGHERALAKILLVCNAISMIALPILCLAAGTVGAAIAVSGSTVAWNVWTLLYCRKYVGVDPSVLSYILPKPSVDRS